MTSMSGNEVLMSSGKSPKAAEWPSDGWTVEGEIVSAPRSYQVREFNKDNPTQGALKFYSNGDPVLGVMIDVRTNERSIDNPEDNGVRRMYVDKSRMLTVVRDAVLETGAKGLEAGGWLSITRTGTEPGQGSIPAQTFTATYRRPGTFQHPVSIPQRPPDGAPVPQQQWAQMSAPQQALARHQQALVRQMSQQQTPAPPVAPQQYVPTSSAPTPQRPATQEPVAPQMPQSAPTPTTSTTDGRPVITASTAAALANVGVPLGNYIIVAD